MLSLYHDEIYRVRVANELGAGNGKAARFASIVSVVQSIIIGLFFCALIMILHRQIALIFTSSTDVLDAVDSLSLLLAITILLNSVQPILSGEFLIFEFKTILFEQFNFTCDRMFMCFNFCRGGCWIWMAIEGCIPKFGMLLPCWGSSWSSFGLGI